MVDEYGAIPGGGEVLVLDGTCYLTGQIEIDTNHVTLRGCGASTVSTPGI